VHAEKCASVRRVRALLDGLERDIVGLALAYFAPNTATIPSTLGEAYTMLKPLTAGKFGWKR
jgi:hypothetical protein